MSLWHPSACGLSTLPGSANTSLPKSAAKRAVINAPLSTPASITNVALANAATIRLRRGKLIRETGKSNQRCTTKIRLFCANLAVFH